MSYCCSRLLAGIACQAKLLAIEEGRPFASASALHRTTAPPVGRCCAPAPGPGRRPVCTVPFEDGDPCLEDHRAAVELFGDEVDAGAVLVITGLDGALVGADPGILAATRGGC